MRAAFLNAAAAAAAIGVIIAPAVPANADAVETIGILQGEWQNVTVDRIGSAPLSECVVTGIRNPQYQTRYVHDDRHGHHNDGDLIPVVIRHAITVSLDCSG
jgi:hypothetical protein